MYELHPYFTNDGTVGLFSRQDDDIYHSTYGALTESWQKFIIPSHLKEFIEANTSVKILDICYGIGYNTKTALNVFLENVLNKNEKQNSEKNIKNNNQYKTNIAPIYTDNITQEKNNKNAENLSKNAYDSNINTEAIYSDNILQDNFKEILIDAVDNDKTLIELSPFLIRKQKCNLFQRNNYLDNNLYADNVNDKFFQIKKMQNTKSVRLKNKYKLKKEVQIIILENLLNKSQNKFDIFNDKILQCILNHKKYLPFLDKFMLNLASFYKNGGYNKNSKLNNSTFLHNIYYKYISKSYKNVRKVLLNNKIDINLHHNDARKFVTEANQCYDFIFLDAFTPAKCPALWTVEFFNKLYSLLNENGMILTYSNSAAIRNAFLQNGFMIGKIYDAELKKFTGTIAVKKNNLIEHPLDEFDLGLINSKAGICYNDKTLDLDNDTIIMNRANAVKESNLVSSSKYIKEFSNK